GLFGVAMFYKPVADLFATIKTRKTLDKWSFGFLQIAALKFALVLALTRLLPPEEPFSTVSAILLGGSSIAIVAMMATSAILSVVSGVKSLIVLATNLKRRIRLRDDQGGYKQNGHFPIGWSTALKQTSCLSVAIALALLVIPPLSSETILGLGYISY